MLSPLSLRPTVFFGSLYRLSRFSCVRGVIITRDDVNFFLCLVWSVFIVIKRLLCQASVAPPRRLISCSALSPWLSESWRSLWHSEHVSCLRGRVRSAVGRCCCHAYCQIIVLSLSHLPTLLPMRFPALLSIPCDTQKKVSPALA